MLNNITSDITPKTLLRKSDKVCSPIMFIFLLNTLTSGQSIKQCILKTFTVLTKPINVNMNTV